MSIISHDFLQTGEKWTAGEIALLTYSFPTSNPLYYFGGAQTILHTASFVPFTETQISAEQQDIVRSILSDSQTYRVSFSDVINANFIEDTLATGDIIIMNQNRYNAGDPSASYIPNIINKSLELAGDVFINSLDTNALTQLAPGEYGFWLHLHELGHAVGGLEDVHLTSEAGGQYDSQKYTMMSYNPWLGVYASGLQLLDIAALQDTYGSRNYTTRAGATEYSLGHGLGFFGASETDPFMTTIWDGGGTDTINASDFSGVHVKIDLRQGAFSNIGAITENVAIAYHTIIENATGTEVESNAGDVLIGNDWKNELKGLAGDDKLYADGFVYDGDHGFKDVDQDNPDGPAPASDDDTLDPGLGADEAYGGVGNDTFKAIGDSGGLEGDLYHGGGYEGGTGNAADQIDFEDDGYDTVDYSQNGYGLTVDLTYPQNREFTATYIGQ